MGMKIDKAIVGLAAAITAVATVALAAESEPAGQTPSQAIGERAVVPQAINITAILIEERCLSGDVVEVTLSGMGNSSSPAEFAWDFTNNGSIDTGILTNPRVETTYTDEVNVTAELFARNDEGQMDSDTITFATLRCE
jgi:hypothetical protein